MKPRMMFALTLVALVLIFALQNGTNVEVVFLFWSVAMPRAALIFVVLAVGLVAGWFLRGSFRFTKK